MRWKILYVDLPMQPVDFLGVVQGATWSVPIKQGHINRESKNWDFKASNGTKFHAKLVNRNMVNGTGQQPVKPMVCKQRQHMDRNLRLKSTIVLLL